MASELFNLKVSLMATSFTFGNLDINVFIVFCVRVGA